METAVSGFLYRCTGSELRSDGQIQLLSQPPEYLSFVQNRQISLFAFFQGILKQDGVQSIMWEFHLASGFIFLCSFVF